MLPWSSSPISLLAGFDASAIRSGTIARQGNSRAVYGDHRGSHADAPNCTFSDTVQARRPPSAPERAQERRQVVFDPADHRKLQSRPPADSSAALRDPYAGCDHPPKYPCSGRTTSGDGFVGGRTPSAWITPQRPSPSRWRPSWHPPTIPHRSSAPQCGAQRASRVRCGITMIEARPGTPGSIYAAARALRSQCSGLFAGAVSSVPARGADRSASI